MLVRRTPLLALLPLVALLAACTGGKGYQDAGVPCSPALGCLDGVCADGRCVAACQDATGWTECNSTDLGTLHRGCCSPQAHCCYRGTESYACLPTATPCPVRCGYKTVCSVDSRCMATAWQNGVSAEGCVDLASDGGGLSCTTDCPVDRQCGTGECCGEGTRCASVKAGAECCVPLLDGGPGDAGPADVSVD